MNEMKRSANDCSEGHDDGKRLKRDANGTSFEDLSNEIIYEVFEYLHSHHAYQSFYHLNSRFQNLFTHSDLPISIDISSISKETFRDYSRDIIQRRPNQIQAIRLFNSWTMGVSTSLLSMMTNFTQLKALVINDIESDHIDQFMDALPSLPSLTAFSITCVDKKKLSAKLYLKLFRLPTLKYLQTQFATKLYFGDRLPTATNEFSSMEHLLIDGEIEVDELNSFLSYVPKLRHLSLKNLRRPLVSRTHRTSHALHYLRSASLRMYAMVFTEFELLVSNFLSQISRLSVSYQCASLDDAQYLDANRWERLISTQLPNLRLFDFHHEVTSLSLNVGRQKFENYISQFDSIFWTTRQWFFEHRYFPTGWSAYALFFSTNSHRRKLTEIRSDGLPDRIQSQRCLVDQLCIHNADEIRVFPGCFPNATKLCLSRDFNLLRKSLVDDLNGILSLRPLHQLTINYHRFPFEQVIELLSLSPRLHTLQLAAVLLYRTKSSTIEHSDLFRLVSSTNTVSHLAINQRMTLEKIRLLTTLFPRLECLTVYLASEDLEPIVRFLCTNHRLSSLCFTGQEATFFDDLERFLSAEKLLHDYTLKISNEKVCLWW